MARHPDVIQGFFPRGVQVVQPRMPQPAGAGRQMPQWVQAHVLNPAPPPARAVSQPKMPPPPPMRPTPHGTSTRLPNELATARAGGMPLPQAVRQRMEAAFGTSFADVRVHVDDRAASIGALAYTRGSNIHFAPGHYDAQTAHGRHLIAHELAHVVQQRAGRVRNPFGSGVAVVQDTLLEAEAERLAMRAIAAPPVQPKMARPFGIVQRAEENPWKYDNSQWEKKKGKSNNNNNNNNDDDDDTGRVLAGLWGTVLDAAAPYMKKAEFLRNKKCSLSSEAFELLKGAAFGLANIAKTFGRTYPEDILGPVVNAEVNLPIYVATQKAAVTFLQAVVKILKGGGPDAFNLVGSTFIDIFLKEVSGKVCITACGTELYNALIKGAIGKD